MQNCSWKHGQKVSKKLSLRVLDEDRYYWATQCELLAVLLATADLFSSFCRFNDNQISLNSVFFLAQSLPTLENIKMMNLRYDQEYLSYFFAI